MQLMLVGMYLFPPGRRIPIYPCCACNATNQNDSANSTVLLSLPYRKPFCNSNYYRVYGCSQQGYFISVTVSSVPFLSQCIQNFLFSFLQQIPPFVWYQQSQILKNATHDNSAELFREHIFSPKNLERNNPFFVKRRKYQGPPNPRNLQIRPWDPEYQRNKSPFKSFTNIQATAFWD